MRSMLPNRTGLLWLAGLLVALSGCSDKPSSPRPVHPAAGRVTYKGAPADGVRVVLIPAGGAGPTNNPAGRTGADGRFELSTFAEKDGAPEGEYAVTLYWPERPFDTLEDGAPMPKDKLGGAYATPAKSKLRAKIEPKKNELSFEVP